MCLFTTSPKELNGLRIFVPSPCMASKWSWYSEMISRSRSPDFLVAFSANEGGIFFHSVNEGLTKIYAHQYCEGARSLILVIGLNGFYLS